MNECAIPHAPTTRTHTHAHAHEGAVADPSDEEARTQVAVCSILLRSPNNIRVARKWGVVVVVVTGAREVKVVVGTCSRDVIYGLS